jgi:hypothetical protein
MQDWAVRTENPYEANLFYLPLFNTHNGGNVGWQQGASGAHVGIHQTGAGKGRTYWVAALRTASALFPCSGMSVDSATACSVAGWAAWREQQHLLMSHLKCCWPAGHIRHAVKYVNSTLPFWQRHNGSDHVYWISNDWGSCGYPKNVSKNVLRLPACLPPCLMREACAITSRCQAAGLLVLATLWQPWNLPGSCSQVDPGERGACNVMQCT